MAACLSAGLISSASAEGLLAAEEAHALTPAYFMDFNLDADGKFYDSPEGTEGRMEVPRTENPSDINLVQYAVNTDDKIIMKTGNTSNLVPTAETNSVYAAFSNKSMSGTNEDTSLKLAHVNGQSTFATAELKFPKAYGGTDVREFIGEATKNADTFKQGLKSVKLCGNKKDVGQSLILCKPQIRLQNDNIIYVVFVV